MQRPRPFRREQCNKDRYTDQRTSNRDAWGESSRKRKSSYDHHQRSRPTSTRGYGFPKRSSPKLYSDDLCDRERRSSIPASPRRYSDDLRDRDCRSSIPASPHRGSSHFRDYPHKTHSWDQKNYTEAPHSDKRDKYETRSEYWDQKNYAEAPHSGKRDKYETRSEYTEYSSFRGHSLSPHHKDFSPLSVGRTHKISKWPTCMTKDYNQFEHQEANEQKAQDKNVSHFQDFRDCGQERLDQMEVLATNCLDRSSKNIGGSQNVHQVNETGSLVLNIHGRDRPTCKASRRSPLRTEPVSHFGSRESNAPVAREDNASDFMEFRNSGPLKLEQVNIMASSSCDVGFENLRESQSLRPILLKAQTPAVGFDEKGWQTHKASEWSPKNAGHFNQQSNREQHASHFQEFQNCGPKDLVHMTVASSSDEHASINIRASQSSKQNYLNTGAFGGDFDAECSNVNTHKSESSSIMKTVGEASTISGFDCAKMLGEHVGTSECDLQHETSRLLQNALRLLSAASGIVSADASCGKTQGEDDAKIMKLLLDSGIQNLKHSLVETAASKYIEATPNLDNFGPNGEKDSVRLDGQCKNENKSSAFTEKLWDGTLQLSTTVSVSAVAFFKSGEKMQEFNWSGSVEVKGKVRLEAFEKYVQDLPRSRSRGLMVVSFCSKEGFSDAGFKCMKEIAGKYKERRKVGFAQLSTGVDLYICPHSDAVITILAKHGFFKGMAAVRDKSDPLIGCVVWRKTPSSVPPLKATEMSTPQSASQPSLRSPSSSSVQQDQSESSIMANNNRESISSLSSVGGVTSKVDNNPDFGTNTDLEKSNSQPPTVVAENFAASSDDDDLPEYDFGAVSGTLGDQTSEVAGVNLGFEAEKFRESDAPRSLSTPIGSESSNPSRTLPDFHFQGLLSSHSMEHRSSGIPSSPIEPQKLIKECKEFSKAPDNQFQGQVLQNLGNMLESQNSSLSVKQQKQIEKSTASKSSTLFDDNDDDDIPEWCPPPFTKPGIQVAQMAGACFIPNHSKVPTSGFADSQAVPLPPLPPTPPAQLQLQSIEYDSKVPTSGFGNPRSGLLPPLPPTPPAQLQLRSEEYHSKVPTSGFANSHSGPLPPLPSTPPPAQLQLQTKVYHSKVPTSGFADSHSGPLPPLPPTPPPAHLQRSKEYHSAPDIPTSIVNRPFTDGFVHKSLDLAQGPASWPQTRFDPVGVGKPVHHPAWRPSRP